jgi:hypothetical protein
LLHWGLLFSCSGLTTVAKLIGCNVGELKLALSTRKMRVGNDTIVQKLTLSQVRKCQKSAFSIVRYLRGNSLLRLTYTCIYSKATSICLPLISDGSKQAPTSFQTFTFKTVILDHPAVCLEVVSIWKLIEF